MIRPSSHQAHLLWVPGSTKQRRPGIAAGGELAQDLGLLAAHDVGEAVGRGGSIRPGTSRTARPPSAGTAHEPGRELRRGRRGRAT